MFDKLFFARASMVAVGCAAAAVTIIGPAQADGGSTTVSPAGAAVTATNQGPVTATVGIVTASCDNVTATGSVPAAPNNQNSNGPVSVSIGSPAVSGCSGSIPGTTATASTSGNWAVSVQNGSSIAGNLMIPQGGLTITTSGLANCVAVVAPDGPVSVTGTFTNGSPSTVSASNVTVPVSITGGGLCPTNTTATVSAVFALTNATDPTQPITVGP
ncbi:hypothetical protein [Nocardia sp. NPDC020380]|uniref:hypothetical protein n=1 Tax=Nocardia sp. NPDC020380 TaxID=3364309 RepID=UPI0037AE1988